MTKPIDPRVRFWLYFTPVEGECWPWQGARVGGYGRFSVNRKSTLAHRFAYELLVGPIPEGLTIDHLCRNRACVNPAHMEPVTPQENTARGTFRQRRKEHYAARTHCKRGHEYTTANTRVRPTKRECKTCARLLEIERRNRRAA